MRFLRLIVDAPPPPEHSQGKLPSLTALLSRGAPIVSHGSTSLLLAETFGLSDAETPGALPIAPCTLAMDGVAPGEDFWLRADPVCLQANLDHLLLDTMPLRLDAMECQALLATLNRHFAEDGLQFLAPVPDRWYLRLAAPAAISCPPPEAVRGRRLHPAMLAGPEAALWQGRLNEIQMLLHAHPVNAVREAQGLPVVNSLWLWGGGQYRTLPAAPFDAVYATQPTAVALSRAAGRLEGHADGLAAIDEQASSVLVVLGLDDGPRADDPAGWLSWLETHWLQPVLRRLRRGQLSHFRLDWPDSAPAGATLTPWQSWCFWRRPLEDTAGHPASAETRP